MFVDEILARGTADRVRIGGDARRHARTPRSGGEIDHQNALGERPREGGIETA
jgi:hypothetical protein